MNGEMPRKLPLYVLAERSRHGRVVFYFRRGKGPRIRLPDPASRDFQAAYSAALTGSEPVTQWDTEKKSLRWLVERYKESAVWLNLSPSTRYQRDRFYIRAVEAAGNDDYRDIDRRAMQRAMDKRAATPSQANCFLKAMRGLFDWAVRNDHMDVNPCIGVDSIRTKSDGFPPWAIEDVAAYRARHPRGSKARLAMEFMLLTGLRRGDMAKVGRQHIKDGVLSLRTSKTGTPVTIRLPEYLVELVDATPRKGMHLIEQEDGKPYTVESFGNMFRGWCDQAGVEKSAHGLRKLSATLAAEGGAAAHELMAQYGWAKLSQAEIYTKGADRARLGIRNSEVVAAQIGNMLAPHLDSGCGAAPRKRLK